MVDKVDFFCLQINTNVFQKLITLGMRSQTCPKYPKQQGYNIFQYLKENVEDEVDFLPADKR